MSEKFLVIGNGGREHAIVAALARSEHNPLIYGYGSKVNPGIDELSEEYGIGKVENAETIIKFIREQIGGDMGDITVIIGPEAPLQAGLTDRLKNENIKVFAPNRLAAEIETSKEKGREIVSAVEEDLQMAINPGYRVFYEKDVEDSTDLKAYIQKLWDAGGVVVKANGIEGGKGVQISGDHLKTSDEALQYAIACIKKGKKVVIEEKLVGEEFSYISFSDGKHLQHTFPIQDHKRAHIGDKGLNTGGMGTYSDVRDGKLILPFLNDEDIKVAQLINQKTTEYIQAKTGERFIGALYGSFMKTKDGKIKVIEFNARLGDSEAENILMLLKSDFVDLVRHAVAGTLNEYNIEFHPKASVVKYVVPEGYPDYIEGKPNTTPFSISEKISGNGFYYYFADVEAGEGKGNYIGGGSRLVAATAMGNTLKEAEKYAELAASNIKGKVRYRPDVGRRDVFKVDR